MQNYLKKSEQRQLVSLCTKCLLNAFEKNDEITKTLMKQSLEILEQKNIFKL